ncbi:unnamed protein product [Didymodactylos carnosus]|uniref:FLYWCH-type domain-containing protein n=1 Tax=Didymodactylos carnosus TaxID=1234261 RepID=A0A814D970_9BILA|nr:unnamed protein product [Didymodactylos carnosus]CAF3728230.1 unnamed protein product [Didymodactylos carnosus]
MQNNRYHRYKEFRVSVLSYRFTENKTYWRCIYYNSQKCHARLHTCNITNNVITPPSDHTCKRPDRMLIFASSEQLDILQSCDDFLVDGTFKVVPEIFYQLYVVHAIYRGHAIPVVYSLLSRKNSDTYQRLINEIVEFAPCWFPASILLDFEKTLGYQNRYQEDVKFAHNINKIAALAFIPPCDVLHAYSRLALDLDDDYQDILNYFEDTYIGRLRPNDTRRQPTFSIEFWNMHSRTTQLSMRTNNSVEAWHRRIGCVFQCAHSTL